MRCLGSFERELAAALREDDPARADRALGDALALTAPRALLDRLAVVATQVMQEEPGAKPAIEHFRNARILEAAIDRLDAAIGPDGQAGRRCVVLGNAWQDYHDLGRRIIGIALRAAGYRVVDLGLSAPNEALADAAIREGSRVIGVSSLLLHTARHIPELQEELRRRGRSDIRVIVGGAPFLVDPQLRERYGADGVATDPGGALRLVAAIYAEQEGSV